MILYDEQNKKKIYIQEKFDAPFLWKDGKAYPCVRAFQDLQPCWSHNGWMRRYRPSKELLAYAEDLEKKWKNAASLFASESVRQHMCGAFAMDLQAAWLQEGIRLNSFVLRALLAKNAGIIAPEWEMPDACSYEQRVVDGVLRFLSRKQDFPAMLDMLAAFGMEEKTVTDLTVEYVGFSNERPMGHLNRDVGVYEITYVSPPLSAVPRMLRDFFAWEKECSFPQTLKAALSCLFLMLTNPFTAYDGKANGLISKLVMAGHFCRDGRNIPDICIFGGVFDSYRLIFKAFLHAAFRHDFDDFCGLLLNTQHKALQFVQKIAPKLERWHVWQSEHSLSPEETLLLRNAWLSGSRFVCLDSCMEMLDEEMARDAWENLKKAGLLSPLGRAVLN